MRTISPANQVCGFMVSVGGKRESREISRGANKQVHASVRGNAQESSSAESKRVEFK
jgi:hypothetical protein